MECSEQRHRPLLKKASFDIAVSAASQVTSSTGWSPSNVCGLSTPPPSTTHGMAAYVAGVHKKEVFLVVQSELY